ncbi:MAG: hypothetical protein R3Y08_03815 [Rikenellaceae bacterium]
MRQKLFTILIALFVISPFCASAQVPEWFSKPQDGEYVGVSVPGLSNDESLNFAVMTALISYDVQHADVGETETIYELGYEVTQTYINDYGEMFVSLRITPDSQSMYALLEHIEMKADTKKGTSLYTEEINFGFQNKECEYYINNVFIKNDSSDDVIKYRQKIEGIDEVIYDGLLLSTNLLRVGDDTTNDTQSIDELTQLYDYYTPISHSLGLTYFNSLLSLRNRIVHYITYFKDRTYDDNTFAFTTEVKEGNLYIQFKEF